jgi:FlaA1/EpsC-like NDP-sugar epimerase
VYAVLAAVSYGVAFLLRFDFLIPPDQQAVLFATLPAVLLLRLGASYAFGISMGRWRYAGTHDVARLVVSAAAASLLLFLLSWGLQLFASMPRSVIAIDLLLFTTLTAGVWIVYRTGFERLRARAGAPRTRVLIVGAGDAGSMLAREMVRSSVRCEPVGFVDDDPAKADAMLNGVRVLGPVSGLPALVKRFAVEEIVIAVPSASPRQLRRIVEACEATDLAFKVLPGIADVMEGRVRWSQVRPLRIEDLLGREPVNLALPELLGDLKGRSVLITGAAGSIGSELARQVAMHQPQRLILFDQSETGLFDLAHELERRYTVDMHFVVGDVADEVAVSDVFSRFAPERVFHAAAYKHVGMMQANMRQAIRNNVTGTLLLATAAGRCGTARFILVSTDKAVVPSSFMGASKRLAELLLNQMQAAFPSTSFAAVRFGNVLGSNGSVVPIFRRQIEEGRPLTVTHPDATRYFMMIPEAVQLILQASLLPDMRGQIAMLDMGEPVRIVDLARTLLRISGLPHRNGSMIQFTGLREGEKLHEQLMAPGERTVPTRIAKVHIIVPEAGVDLDVVRRLPVWEAAFREGRHHDVLLELTSLFPQLAAGDVPVRAALRRAV